ncbi:F0F1 ATP synthase subunit gamma [Croceicoccus marinus]|jgi:F-type H+-transporting ATPase subunit gamma|uniref:H(+)-transporting ATPase n=1 Tax=Croceicoccus marinus TaxID=450378 RepID=A0A1Z1FHG7_9SPHN|nr:F0F1 ATP synthase subunit gamma [Croceicoccus marinus]ARU18202.1 H(+)-transporting ATPase [Croceicoccus marinus]|tara:strand:+ start:73704 stop:74588 length:885 start_codon:yes stop_codon:yes gene_type:complete
MSNTTEGLKRKIQSADDLQSVVRTMKALAASSIGQFERSVRGLADYQRAVELGLGVCFRQSARPLPARGEERHGHNKAVSAIVFGSDQGLVGQFNDVIAEHAITTLAALHGKCLVWAIGERISARLADAGLQLVGLLPVPSSIQAIASLVAQVQLASETQAANGASLWVFHNRPLPGSLYEPVGQRLLPLDTQWQQDLLNIPWPAQNLPEIVGANYPATSAFIREFLFISLFRACAESLASENASRLVAMERADKNISELLEQLRAAFHQLRQSDIDEELFDVISGFDALASSR